VTLAETIATRIEAGIATDGDLALAARALRTAGAGQPVLALMAAAARVRRDEMLIELWRVRFTDASPYAAARAIAVMLSRYEATAWRHDRLRASPPDADPCAWSIYADERSDGHNVRDKPEGTVKAGGPKAATNAGPRRAKRYSILKPTVR